MSVYLAKMSMHCPELSQIPDNKLASAVIYISLKTVEQVEGDLQADQYMSMIGRLSKMESEDLLIISQELLNIAKTFQQNYPNLRNLQKFNSAEYEGWSCMIFI